MKCGQSDQRNAEYASSFNQQAYFNNLVSCDKPVIFDVGAHKGESVEFFRSLFPACDIHCFEPNPDSWAHLETLTNIHLHKCALGKTTGKAKFYVQSISHLSSLLEINRDSSDSLGYAKHAENTAIDVDVFTGSDMARKQHINHIDILKVDVQGAEVDVLSGFSDYLPYINTIIVEIGLFDFYSRRSSFYAIEEQIRQHFQLWDILKLSKNPANFRTDWVEAVYRRFS
ncbi:FkbM family methyltransferase [Aestuariibacter salexigens]|uniref:FkbM family methyltransferase n=1 Tax=Aestuariibacter salexigens TaxID=226010 RepID=UPI000400CC43|nr:FkbM family methyltransferase [Aestuariibacter salexigens]